jgi:hypothetical protein
MDGSLEHSNKLVTLLLLGLHVEEELRMNANQILQAPLEMVPTSQSFFVRTSQ